MRKYLKIVLALMLAVTSASYARADDKVVNVLCYHKLFTPGGEAKGGAYGISPERFEEHMRFLKDNGYSVISMAKYLDYLDGKGELADKTVVITIDDGYKSVYEYGYPLLKKYGYPAVNYLYTVFFPQGGAALSVEQVKEMEKDGIEPGCHSWSHPYLTRRRQSTKDKELGDAEYLAWLEREIIFPKEGLEKLLGVKVETYAYPYGLYSEIITPIVQKAGYRAAFSVVASYNTKDTPRYALKRTMIFNSTTNEKLKKILEKKPIKVKELYPPDGAVFEERWPEIRVVLAEDSLLNTATIKFKMDNEQIGDSSYDAQSKTALYRMKKELGKGIHLPVITANGKDGARHEYAWLFVVGKPINTEK